jgi:hypothetical protein
MIASSEESTMAARIFQEFLGALLMGLTGMKPLRE